MKKGQKPLRPKTDVDYWNFGLLKSHGDFRAKGYVQIVRMEAGEAVHSAGFIPPGTLVLFIRNQGLIRSFDIHNKRAADLWRGTDAEKPLDMCLWKDSVYVLEGHSRTVRLISDENIESWQLQCDPLSDASRLAITNIAKGDGTELLLAFVGPTESGRLHVIPLGTDSTHEAANIEQGLARSKELASINKSFSMCVDRRSHALLVADACRHRVLAIRWSDGQTKVICGAGKTYSASERTSTDIPDLNEPTSLAIYELGLIKGSLFDTGSRKMVNESLNSSYPRTIIIADRARHMVQRLIEMGGSPAMVSLAHVNLLHILVGDGIAPEIPIIQLNPHVPDLRQYRVLEPSHVSVSSRGDLTVVAGSGRALMVACPASALVPDLLFSHDMSEYYGDS